MDAEMIEETKIMQQKLQMKEMYEKFRDKEKPERILEAFSLYLLKILNGLSQIESSMLCGYEAKILGNAMHLFCMHYAEQADSAMKKDNPEEKKVILEDIEASIGQMSNVYKNIIDSTANSDRQLFTSQAVESSIYEISPKLFAAYSVILQTLVRLFEKQETYAFLLHPSLKSNIETESLFNMREKEGKVVLIYIPENKIENIRQVPTFLFHEAFHVLTKDERNRKDRAESMEIHVHNAILQRIFKNVEFHFAESDADIEEAVKKELMQRWFAIDMRIQELKTLDKDDRKLYSKNVLKQLYLNWREWLAAIFSSLGKDLCHVLDGKKFLYGTNPYLKITEIEWQIQRNIMEILSGNRILQYAELYMSIYRETYADIACILMAGISPNEYEQAFADAKIVASDDVAEKGVAHALRVHIVAGIVAACDGISYCEEWKTYSREHDFREMEYNQNQTMDTTAIKGQNNIIHILEDDLERFEGVLKSCSEKLWQKIGKEDGSFGKFRKIIREIDMKEILNGKLNEKLYELQEMNALRI